MEWLRRACEQSAIIYSAAKDTTGQSVSEEAESEEMAQAGGDQEDDDRDGFAVRVA